MPERSDGHIIDSNVDASRTAGEGDIRAVVHDDRYRKGRYQGTAEIHERPRINEFEPELDNRGPPSGRGARAGDEPFATVTQIVGDRDQREIDRRASLCSENVSLNS